MTLNFPFFLYKCLVKMSKQVKRNVLNPLSSLHHSGLIKILACGELERWKETCVSFFNRNRFGFSPQNMEVTSQPDSVQEKDNGEGLSDEVTAL